MSNNSFEEKMPFIAAILSGLFSTAITWAWFEDKRFLILFLPLTIAVLVILRFNPSSFIAGLVTDFLVASIGYPNITLLFFIASLVGVFWETGTAIINGSLGKDAIIDRSTPVHNSLFAGLGILMNLFMYIKIGQKYGYVFTGSDVGKKFLEFGDMVLKILMMPLARSKTWFFEKDECIFSIVIDLKNFHPAVFEMLSGGGVTKEGIFPIFLALAKAFILSPPFWAAFFAALRQLGFRFWNLPLLIRQTLKAYCYGNKGIGSGIIFLILLIPMMFLPVDLQGFWFLAWVSLNYFNFILRVGHGAQNGL